jgi:hypothetical protein
VKKIELLSLFLAFSFGSAFIQAQDLDMPPGSVMRMTNCSIVGDRLDFEDILERARAIEFDENAPNIIFFRRPIYASPEYHQNYDFQIAQYYSSFNEMRERRSASGNNSYGRLSISCGPGYVATNVIINQDQLEDQSLMTTRRCNITNGGSTRAAYNRLRQASANIAADSGNTTMAQMWLPALGGPMNQSFDFVFALVGTNGEELMQRLDLFREGYRPFRANNGGAFSCDRPSLWSTNRVYQADQ